MDDKEQLKQEKRQARRRRRIKNQIAAYLVLIILVVAAAFGIVYAVNFLHSQAAGQDEAGGGNSQDDPDKQDIIDDLLSSEEPISTPEPTPEPTPEVVEPTPEERLEEIVGAAIEVMSLEDKVAGLFIVTPEAITGVGTAVRAGEGTQNALAQYAVGGIVYFDKNIQSEQQITEMLANTASYAKYPVFLAVDEEGGSVARVASSGIGSPVDSADVIGATGDAENARQAGITIGGTLAALGFNLDFAPVADLANVEGSVMVKRAYGSDPSVVAGFVTAMMSGLEGQNVTACLKHFPGIGSTTEDTHNGRAFSDRTAEQFRAEELAVFQAGIDAGANMIMVSHIAAPALTGDNEPCTFSKALITDILREEMGYDGVVITDALNMAAISEYYAADEAAIMAVLAGCDMLLMPEDFQKAYNGVLQAVRDGIISEERINDSLRRIYRIKYADRIR